MSQGPKIKDKVKGCHQHAMAAKSGDMSKTDAALADSGGASVLLMSFFHPCPFFGGVLLSLPSFAEIRVIGFNFKIC